MNKTCAKQQFRKALLLFLESAPQKGIRLERLENMVGVLATKHFLKKNRKNMKAAAKDLSLPCSTLVSRMKVWGIYERRRRARKVNGASV